MRKKKEKTMMGKRAAVSRALIALFLVSLALFALSLLFPTRSSAVPKSSESAILNPKFEGAVDSVAISGGGQSVRLVRTAGVWSVSSGGTESLADARLVASFLKSCAKIRRVFEISSSEGDKDALSLTEGKGTTVVFSSLGNEVSRVVFGRSDAISGRIPLSPSGSPLSLETEDDLSHFLSGDADYWAAGELFCGLGEIVQARMSVADGSFSASAGKGDDGFPALSSALSSIRHGKIAGRIGVADASLPVFAAIEAHDGDGKSMRAEFMRGSGGILVRKRGNPPVPDDAVYGISDWTFGKLASEFGMENIVD